MKLRKATLKDYNAIWEIFKLVIETEDTHVFKKNTPKADLHDIWFADYMTSFVVESENRIVGTYMIRPNYTDLGNHIANCGYLVHPKEQGRGIGKRLCEHSIETAREMGYRGMQFNIVISTNTAAVNLWKKFGFKIIGTTPGGFRHKTQGFVDTYMMYKALK